MLPFESIYVKVGCISIDCSKKTSYTDENLHCCTYSWHLTLGVDMHVSLRWVITKSSSIFTVLSSGYKSTPFFTVFYLYLIQFYFSKCLSLPQFLTVGFFVLMPIRSHWILEDKGYKSQVVCLRDFFWIWLCYMKCWSKMHIKYIVLSISCQIMGSLVKWAYTV